MDPDNRTERVLPLLRAACEDIPAELRDLHPADFTGERDSERELGKLIAVLTGTEAPVPHPAVSLPSQRPSATPPEQPAARQGHFDQPDWKVDNITQIAQQTVYNTYTEQTPPAADKKRHFFTVPFPRNADFVGRDANLTTLHAALSGDGPVGILPAGLTGQGGMGKTALAVEYCHRHRDDYEGGVFWVNAAESLAQGFAALGCVINPANFDRPIPRQIDAAARYLNDHPDGLLVLDNVEDPAILARPVATGLIPTELACRVLFTTRRRDLPARCRPVEVTVLPESTALSLLLRHPGCQFIRQPGHPQHAEARRICR